MAAFLIAHVTVKDQDKLNTYVGSVGATLAPFGGELQKRGALIEVLAGEHDHKLVAILKFPDKDAIKGWFESDAYQALIPNRLEAADMTLIAYNEPPA